MIPRQEGVFFAVVSKIVEPNNSCSDSTFRSGEYFNGVKDICRPIVLVVVQIAQLAVQ